MRQLDILENIYCIMTSYLSIRDACEILVYIFASISCGYLRFTLRKNFKVRKKCMQVLAVMRRIINSTGDRFSSLNGKIIDELKVTMSR